MKIAITTPQVLRALQASQQHLPYRERAKPYNFVLSPLLQDIDGYPQGIDPDKFTLVAPFTKDRARWTGLDYTNIHDGKKYRLAKPGARVSCEANPKAYGDLLERYIWHREAKSLAAAGMESLETTTGLLTRMPVHAHSIQLIGKETDRRWEQGEDISLLDSKLTIYRPNETKKLAVDSELQQAVRKVSRRELARTSGLSENTIKRARRGERLQKATIIKLWEALARLIREAVA